MRLIKDPIQETYGMCYIPKFTDEFMKLVEDAKNIIIPYSSEKISIGTVYFKVKDEEVCSEFDCCSDVKCIKQTKIDIRKQYGKGTHVEAVWYDNDGDHERIEICCQCSKPLNEWLTWCESELQYLDQCKPWSTKFLKDEGFLISCILCSSPTMDCEISRYAIHQGGDILIEALKRREEFFQRIYELAESVIENIPPNN
jgi:hypothetical protein